MTTAYAVAAGKTEAESLGVYLAGFAGLWAGMLGTLWVARSAQPGGTFRSEFGWEFRWIDAPIGLGVGLFCQLVLLRLVYLPWQLLDPDVNERLAEPAESLTGVADGFGLFVLALCVAIGAPIVEELFYRGLVFRSMLRLWRVPVAVIVSGVLFGLIHMRLITLPGLAAFGIVLAWLTHRYGRLGPAVMSHIVFNTITVLALVAAR